MANLRLAHLVLNDKWPGSPHPNQGIPTDGWDNTTENFNTADDTAKALNPPIPLGEKRQAYHDSTLNPGWYTMQYMVFTDISGSADISADFSDGLFWCGHRSDVSTSQWSDTSITPPFIVHRCGTAVHTDNTAGAFGLAVPCATLNADNSSATNGFGDAYGWFWVGGVCPITDVTLFTDTTNSGDASTGHGVDVTVGAVNNAGPVFLDATLVLVTSDTSNVLDATGLTGIAPPIDGWVCTSAG